MQSETRKLGLALAKQNHNPGILRPSKVASSTSSRPMTKIDLFASGPLKNIKSKGITV